MDRTETAGLLGWPTCVGVMVAFGVVGCFHSYVEVGDDDSDARTEVGGEVYADDVGEVDAVDDADGVPDDVADHADAETCAGGWLDPTTGLCWQDPTPLFDDSSTGRVSWRGAVDYCENLDRGGRAAGTWHLPTISELRSLVRGWPPIETGGACGVTDHCLAGSCWSFSCRGCTDAACRGAHCPGDLRGPLYAYWSSSINATDDRFAWTVDFFRAEVRDLDTGSVLVFARCVRPGP
ncbi:MAG: DUF1566 domain-containing protein [Deltaproteobacteria bacterium]|nr:DUF1566 domain-containing protein [Deltaproteobacteria bacterium]